MFILYLLLPGGGGGVNFVNRDNHRLDRYRYWWSTMDTGMIIIALWVQVWLLATWFDGCSSTAYSWQLISSVELLGSGTLSFLLATISISAYKYEHTGRPWVYRCIIILYNDIMKEKVSKLTITVRAWVSSVYKLCDYNIIALRIIICMHAW